MPPSPIVKSISRTKAVIILIIFFFGIPTLIAGDWVLRKYFPARTSTVPITNHTTTPLNTPANTQGS